VVENKYGPPYLSDFSFSPRLGKVLPNAGLEFRPGSPNFLSEGHISYCTTVRGPDILRNVIVPEDVTFHQINKFFVDTLLFHSCQNGFAGRICPAF